MDGGTRHAKGGRVGQLGGWMEERKDRWKEKRMAGGING